MLQLRKVAYTFAKIKIKNDILYDPTLKDLTKNYELQQQISQLRQQHQQKTTLTFSQALADENPKLGQRFYIQQEKLQKKLRNVYKEKMSPENVDFEKDKNFDFLKSAKSHLYDQKEELEFHEQFSKQYFKMKETKRLLEKKKMDVNTYLPQTKDHEFIRYEEAKTQLKNNRIKNMLNFNKNNEQLQMLIESGLINNPQNLKQIMEQMQQPCIALPQQPTSQQSTPTLYKQTAEELDDVGPQQLKDRQKIVHFLQTYKEMNEDDRRSCERDVQLLHHIKQYEDKVFLQRYDAINFRFKGRVDFNFFHEKELVSYIKSYCADPKQLLLFFDQNKQKLSKFNVPIITPPVLANIYSKTSIYRFPQTDTNNRINMLNNKLFIDLEKQTFKNVEKLSDMDFCSCVWSYAKNHEHEQGILKKKLSDKINEIIFRETQTRINSLNDEDFGLLMRALHQLPLMKYQIEKFTPILNVIDQRLESMENDYAIESTFRFLSTLPQHKQTIKIIDKYIHLFNSYNWTQHYTLSSFIFSSSVVLGSRSSKMTEFKEKVKQILMKQGQNIEKMIPSFSINDIPQFLTVFRESNAHLEMPRLTNVVKKSVHDCINQQKQAIEEKQLPLLVYNIVLVDYHRFLHKKESKLKRTQLNHLLRKSCLTMLMPDRAIAFNSSNYFIYHNLAKLTQIQAHNLSIYHISKIMEALSLINYKNQALFDLLVGRVLESVDEYDEHQQVKYSPLSKAKSLCSMVICFSHQRRNTELYREVAHKMMDEYSTEITKLPPNQLIKMITSMVSLMPIQLQQDYLMDRIHYLFRSVIYPLLKTNIFIVEELLTLAYVGTLIKCKSSTIESIMSHLPPQLNNLGNFITSMTKLILHNNDKNMNEFIKSENAYKQTVMKEILQNQAAIGCQLSYQHVMEKKYQQLREEYGHHNVMRRSWTIEVASERKVYFVATYDHLFSRTCADPSSKVSVSLYGFWKLYEVLYRDWEMQLVISFIY